MWIAKVLVFVNFILINCEEDFHPDFFEILLNTHLHDGIFDFTGSASITITLRRDSEKIKFYHHGLTFKNATIDNLRAEIANDEDDNVWALVKNFTNNIEYVILFDYKGVFPSEFIGHYEDETSTAKYFAAISFKSNSSFMTICPSIADENLRSDFVIKINHDQDYKAVSNGEIKEVTSNDTFKTTEFMKVENFSPSSLAIFISNFESILNDKVEIFGTPQNIREGHFNKSLEIATQVVEELPNYFPLINKIKLIAVPGITSDISARDLIMHYQYNLFYQPNKSSQNQINKITHHVAHAVAVSKLILA